MSIGRKILNDPRANSGDVQGAILDKVDEVMLDPVAATVQEALDIKNPLTTSRPEDLRAKFNISDPLTGAILEAKISSQKQVGDPSYVAAAAEEYLNTSPDYDFATTPASVSVFVHDDRTPSRGDDRHALTVQIPTVDNNGKSVPLDDAGLAAELRRVAPKWYVTVTNGSDTRSAPYITELSSDDTGHDYESVDIFPDRVEASSEHERVVARDSKDVDWFAFSTVLAKADNVLFGEDERHPDDETLGVRVEASSVFIDQYRDFEEEINPSTELLGGFPPRDPNIESVGITAIAAPELEVAATYDIADETISSGQRPTVNLLTPIDYIPITIEQERRLLENPEPLDDLIGRLEIFHEYMKADDKRFIALAGREVRVLAQPLPGGLEDEADLVINPHRVFQEFIPKDSSLRKLTPPGAVVEFAREFFEGPSSKEFEIPTKRLAVDQDLGFSLTVSGSAGGAPPPGGSAADPGLIVIPVKDPGSVAGVTGATGFPSNFNPDFNFLNIQKMVVEVSPLTVNISVGVLGGGINTTGGVLPISIRPEYDMLPNAGDCRSFALTVPQLNELLTIQPGTTGNMAFFQITWQMSFAAQVLYDLWERKPPANTTEVDPDFKDFAPDQTFRVTNITLTGHEAFDLEHAQYYDPQPGWSDTLDDPPTGASIRTHRMKYDRNKVPEKGKVVKAFATYEIAPEIGAQTVQVNVPIPQGLLCDSVEIRFGTQIFTVNLSSPNIMTRPTYNLGTGPVFKAVHLDAIIDPSKYSQYSLASIILFYDPADITYDRICEAYAHYITPISPLGTRNIEDLQSITFTTFDELSVKLWRHNLNSIYTAFFTEAATGAILDGGAPPPNTQMPLDRLVSGGIIFYWKEDLDKEGLMAEVYVTYGDLNNTIPSPVDMATLSVGVPDGRVGSFDIVNLAWTRLYYIDDRGIYRTYIGNFKIKTLEIHFDKNTLPATQVLVQVFANYLRPSPTSTADRELASFGARDLLMVEAQFEGCNVLKILYDTIEHGIIQDTLSEPMRVQNVLVLFDAFPGGVEKVEVKFKPTYLKPLKEVVYLVRQDWIVTAIEMGTPAAGVSLRAVTIVGEFDKFMDLNVGGISPYRAQRLQSVRVLFYDSDLSGDEGHVPAVSLDVLRATNSKFNPFIDGVGKWESPTGLDVQYRVDMSGVKINSLEIDGETSSQMPIMVIEKGISRPFVEGTTYEPSSLLFFYRTIRDIQILYRGQRPDPRHPRQNVLYDDNTYWKSGVGAGQERLEIAPSGQILFNQLVVDLHSSCVSLSEIKVRVLKEGRDYLYASFVPVLTSIEGTSGFNVGSTRLELGTTSDIKPGALLRIGAGEEPGDEYVRVLDVLDATHVLVDPLEANAPAETPVQVVGWDFGEPLESVRTILNFSKADAGALTVRQVRPRLERRFLARANARNVNSRNDESWSPVGGEAPAASARLSLLYDKVKAFNRIDFEEAVESRFKVSIVDDQQGIEREIFLARDLNEQGDVYGTPQKADQPAYRPEVVRTKVVVAEWEEQPRNPLTGLFHVDMRHFIPQFRHDRLNSDVLNALDPNLQIAWRSQTLLDTTSTVSIVADLEVAQTIDRLAIMTQSAGVSVDIYASLGNHPLGFEYVATIDDISEPNPGDVVTQVLNADSGASEPEANRLYMANTSGFEVGAVVGVSDSASTPGEWREIVAIVTNSYLELNADLQQDYLVANGAVAEQSNILIPGTYFPILTDFYCRGDHIRGPRSFRQAYVLPSTFARFFKFVFSGVTAESGDGDSRLIVNFVDLFQALTIP